MRIAIFTNTYGPTINGVAISVANLRQGLCDKGHEVHVFAPAPPGHDVRSDSPGVLRFRSVRPPVEADYPIAVPYSRAVLQALRSHDFDVVHTQHPLWVGEWGRWYAHWARKPLITTIHTQYEIYSRLIPLPDKLIDMYVRSRVRQYCNSCDIVTTPAVSARDRLVSRGVTTPVEVVFNPTDLTACFQADGRAVRERLGVKPDELLLGYVGRLAPEKNLETLLAAAGRVMSQLPKARLVLIGDGPARGRLEEVAAAMPYAARIAFLGRVPHQDIAEHQAALDLFITASTMEVQPLSFAEAFATSTPIIAFNVSGNNDMIQDGISGRLVEVEAGAEGLAAATCAVLADPGGLERLRDNAREWSRRYDLPQVVTQVLETYDRAIGLARRRLGAGAPLA